MNLSKYKRNKRTYEHVIMIVNRFFKKKFVALNLLKMKTIILSRNDRDNTCYPALALAPWQALLFNDLRVRNLVTHR